MSNYVTMVDGLGNYGKCHVWYGKDTVRDGNRPIAVIFHPHLSNADAMADSVQFPGFYGVIEYLARNGYIVVAGDFRKAGNTGNTAQWGNEDNRWGISDAKMFGIAHGGSPSKNIFLVGFSMGALACLNYAGRFSTSVSGVLGILPAIDLAAYKTPGPDGPFAPDGITPYSFAYTITPAYGGTYSGGGAGLPGGPNDGGFSNDAVGYLYNPQYQAETQTYLSTVPIQLWYADADTYAPRAMIKKFVDANNSHNGVSKTTLHRIPGNGLGHTDQAARLVPKSKILEFAQSCVT